MKPTDPPGIAAEIAIFGNLLKCYSVGYRYCRWFGKCVILQRRLRKLVLPHAIDSSDTRRTEKVIHIAELKRYCRSVIQDLVKECRRRMNSIKLAVVLLASVAQILSLLHALDRKNKVEGEE